MRERQYCRTSANEIIAGAIRPGQPCQQVRRRLGVGAEHKGSDHPALCLLVEAVPCILVRSPAVTHCELACCSLSTEGRGAGIGHGDIDRSLPAIDEFVCPFAFARVRRW